MIDAGLPLVQGLGILSKQNPRLNILQRDYYDYKNLPSSTGMSLESLPIAEYLYKYEKVKTIKTAVKESDGKSINWKLVPNDSEFWKEDIVLEIEIRRGWIEISPPDRGDMIIVNLIHISIIPLGKLEQVKEMMI